MLVIMLLFRKRGMECFELNFRWLIWLGGRLSNILTGSQSEPTASLLRDQFLGEALLRKEAYPLHKRSWKVLRNCFIGFERGAPLTGSVCRKTEYLRVESSLVVFSKGLKPV